MCINMHDSVCDFRPPLVYSYMMSNRVYPAIHVPLANIETLNLHPLYVFRGYQTYSVHVSNYAL